jgi:hypothetical protein
MSIVVFGVVSGTKFRSNIPPPSSGLNMEVVHTASHPKRPPSTSSHP